MNDAESVLGFLAQRLPVRDLTADVVAGTLPEFISCCSEVDPDKASGLFQNAAQILFRKDSRHLLISGLKGVGKTSTVIEFARLVATGRFRFLQGHRFIWFNAAHVGPEDSRACLETILLAAKSLRPIVLCLDGIHALLRRPHGGTNKPLLRAGLQDPQVSVIGVLPRWEYNELFGSDADMLELFSRLEVEEPDEATSIQIAESAAEYLADEYQLSIGPQTVRRAVFLSSNFLLSERLPSKAVKILRQACDDVTFARNELHEQRNCVEPDDVVSAMAQKTGMPRETLAGQVSEADWEAALTRDVIGQPRAVRSVANELRIIKAGLSDPGKPASVMLFVGMTGVGKTELAKRLAELYSASRRLQNYSMANFTEAHSVAGIVGVPPGYVGHDEGGRLINDLNADPYSVFLLDEAEKAHPNVWKPFLNLFDEGWIVDQRGVKASADRAIFVLTTNAASDEVQQMTKNNRPIEEIEQRVMSILARVRAERGSQAVFPPQFLARLKKVVVFQALDDQALRMIARKLIGEVAARWQQRRDQRLDVDDDVINWIGNRAHAVNDRSGGKEGGRSIRKLIANYIEIKLAGVAPPTNPMKRSGSLKVRLERLVPRGANSEVFECESPIIIELGDD